MRNSKFKTDDNDFNLDYNDPPDSCSACLYIVIASAILLWLISSIKSFGDFLFYAVIAFLFYWWAIRDHQNNKEKTQNEDIHESDRDRIIEEK